jgi:hypothetical protein
VFDEMRKALATKTHALVLDCNYPKSNKHNKSEAQLTAVASDLLFFCTTSPCSMSS